LELRRQQVQPVQPVQQEQQVLLEPQERQEQRQVLQLEPQGQRPGRLLGQPVLLQRGLVERTTKWSLHRC
jgi:hypothetical protein